jgi:hypothetical protein
MAHDQSQTPLDVSPDRDERIQDFLSRHGGASGRPSRDGESENGSKGWSEVYARDGYILRCDWSRFGSHEAMTYAEIAPDTDR